MISLVPLFLIVAVSLVYINTTIYHPASYSYTTKMFNPQDRPKAMGLHGVGGSFGHSLGPLLVSVLIGVLAFEWRQVYLLLVIPMLLGIVMVISIKKEVVDDYGFPGWLFPNTDYICSFPPFSNLPTQYRITIDGQQKWFAQ